MKKRDGKYWTLYGCYPKQGGYEIDPGYEGVGASEDGMTWKRRQRDRHLAGPSIGGVKKNKNKSATRGQTSCEHDSVAP